VIFSLRFGSRKGHISPLESGVENGVLTRPIKPVPTSPDQHRQMRLKPCLDTERSFLSLFSPYTRPSPGSAPFLVQIPESNYLARLFTCFRMLIRLKKTFCLGSRRSLPWSQADQIQTRHFLEVLAVI
jgi:hypothetical protein